ncbi:putative ribose-5-phosphate isomerase 4, chloroplastic [Canna indica]|uniref:Ribose-5-phosphate isomerase 4, chloroplastic n=1 Tax=Canna indica TaxID=4628 RepID=A0AAQ3KUQ0_9LILI|nr:putative ribose-5-phosphate isomerase 4, chloroplastic [Canna indica]
MLPNKFPWMILLTLKWQRKYQSGQLFCANFQCNIPIVSLVVYHCERLSLILSSICMNCCYSSCIFAVLFLVRVKQPKQESHWIITKRIFKCAYILIAQYIDFAFDDADIIDERTLTAVIGRRKLEGGESIIQEKSIVKTANGLAFMVAENQYTSNLDGSIPVLITSGNWLETAEEIDDLFLGDAEVWRRSSCGDAGPLGGEFPLITREGHHVLDLIFTSPILDLGQIAESLNQIDGVVDHGIVHGIPCTVIIASKEGVEVVDNTSKGQVIDSL